MKKALHFLLDEMSALRPQHHDLIVAMKNDLDGKTPAPAEPAADAPKPARPARVRKAV